MKLSFSLKNKEASLEADVEGIVKKNLEQKEKNPDKRSMYQIRQEEKRKTKILLEEEKRKTKILEEEERRKKDEINHKQLMQYFGIYFGFMILLMIFGFIASVLNI